MLATLCCAWLAFALTAVYDLLDRNGLVINNQITAKAFVLGSQCTRNILRVLKLQLVTPEDRSEMRSEVVQLGGYLETLLAALKVVSASNFLVLAREGKGKQKKVKNKHVAIPKVHALTHMFDNIARFGMAPNFDTAHWEAAHRAWVVESFKADARRDEGMLHRLYLKENLNRLLESYLTLPRPPPRAFPCVPQDVAGDVQSEPAASPPISRARGRPVGVSRLHNEYELSEKVRGVTFGDVVSAKVGSFGSSNIGKKRGVAFKTRMETDLAAVLQGRMLGALGLGMSDFAVYKVLERRMADTVKPVRYVASDNYLRRGARHDTVEIWASVLPAATQDTQPGAREFAVRLVWFIAHSPSASKFAVVRFFEHKYESSARSRPWLDSYICTLMPDSNAESYSIVELAGVSCHAHLVPDFDMFAISSDDGRLIVPDDEQLEFYWDKPQDGRTNVHGGLAQRGGRL